MRWLDWLCGCCAQGRASDADDAMPGAGTMQPPLLVLFEWPLEDPLRSRRLLGNGLIDGDWLAVIHDDDVAFALVIPDGWRPQMAQSLGSDHDVRAVRLDLGRTVEQANVRIEPRHQANLGRRFRQHD